jgi:hypothetical protein
MAWMGVVGASGAISGLLGLYCLRFPWSRVRLAYWAFLPLQAVNRAGIREVPISAAMALWVGLQLVEWFVFQGTARIAYAAHVGGLAAGLLLGLSLGFPFRASVEGLLAGARRGLREGNPQLAVANLGRYIEHCPYDDEARLEYARALRVAGDLAAASSIYREILARFLEAQRTSAAVDVYVEARRADPVFHLPAAEQGRVAFWLEKTGRFAHSVRAHLDFARFHADHPASIHAMARAATLLSTRLGEPDEAREVLDDALRGAREHPLHDWMLAERRRLGRAAG